MKQAKKKKRKITKWERARKRERRKHAVQANRKVSMRRSASVKITCTRHSTITPYIVRVMAITKKIVKKHRAHASYTRHMRKIDMRA